MMIGMPHVKINLPICCAFGNIFRKAATLAKWQRCLRNLALQEQVATLRPSSFCFDGG